MYGSARLVQELRALGHEAELVVAAPGVEFAVVKGFEVPVGRFAGRVIELGLQAPPDYPRSVGSSIHVRTTPQLLEKSDTEPNIRNITDSQLGPDWRYWSHNFQWQGELESSTARLMTKVNGIFDRA